jgi:hypothetical protein
MASITVAKPHFKETVTPDANPAPLSDWIYIPQFLSQPEADRLYALLERLPFINENTGKDAIHYGKSYSLNGGPREHELPMNPVFLPYSDRVAIPAHKRMNYLQIHRMTEIATVNPHRDPSGMIVPMLVGGQSRTFRIGGTMPERMRQSQRKVSDHIPAEEIVLHHGDLLIFNGGRIVHSMFAAEDDENFNSHGFEFRYSLLFRWTTDLMRELGPRAVMKSAAHHKQYRDDGNV